MRSDRLYLEDMLEAARAIVRHLSGFQESAFVSEALRRSHPEVAWRQISGFRNHAVHAYFGVDWSIVWTSARVDVPALRRQVKKILDELPST